MTIDLSNLTEFELADCKRKLEHNLRVRLGDILYPHLSLEDVAKSDADFIASVMERLCASRRL
jgi:hypothetical protein